MSLQRRWTDFTVMIENEALVIMLNRLFAQVISSLTASLRHDGAAERARH